MRFTISFALFLFASPSLAYPSSDKQAAGGECPFAKARRDSNNIAAAGFNPVAQKIDVSGIHAFRPPQAGDLRGPCPGLNALANHGYLPHNGLVTLDQAALASNRVFGMGIEISTLLSTLGVVVAGNPLALQFSIGGAPGTLIPLPLLSPPQGLSGSHNKYETDASPGRGDYFLHNGDASSLNLPNFKSLYDLQPENGTSDYNLDILIKHRKQTLDFSIQNNPHFFHGPITGPLLSNGAHVFIPALMSNHSAEAPNGVLSRDVLKSFFGVEGRSNNLTYKVGYERIPDNWYKRPVDYSIINLTLDIVKMATVVPEALAVGGNMGKVNTFTGVDLSNLTGGLYNAHTLLEGNNLICFVLLTIAQTIPDILKGLISDITSVLDLLTSKIAPQLSTQGCGVFSDYNEGLLKTFPGAQDGGWI